MGNWSKGSIAVMAVALALGVAAGFALGREIGNGDSVTAVPSEITTQRGSLTVPTLSATPRLPALEVSEASEEPSEANIGGEAASSESRFEPESSTPSPEAGREVTVAPND